MGNLDLKTFEAETSEEVDRKVMEFGKNVDVKATQPYAVVKDAKIIHFRVVYHKPVNLETADKVIEDQITEEVIDTSEKLEEKKEETNPNEKKCPGCGEMINARWDKHFKCGWGVNNGK